MIIQRLSRICYLFCSRVRSYWILLARSICVKVKLECRLQLGTLSVCCALREVANTTKVHFHPKIKHTKQVEKGLSRESRFVECTSKSIKQYKMRLLRSRTNPRRSKQPKRSQKWTTVVRLARRRSRCRLTGLKSTHHLKSHKDHRS